MANIVPLRQLNRRMPEAGRIRLGVKGGTMGRKSIDTFRLTSPYPDVIDQAAQLYGAKVGPRPWSDAKAGIKDQHEVILTTKRLRVYLPPDALSCWYELWAGSGCVRRCDGEQVTAVVGRGDAAAETVLPCICEREQNMQCKPTTRLNVILPDLAFRGAWRLETHGWNALHELSGMESMITDLQSRMGVIEAELTLQERSKMTAKGKTNFVVPVLTLTASAQELASGQASVRALAQTPTAPPVAELDAPPTDEATPTPGAEVPAWDEDPDDDIVDAEIVEVATDEPATELTGEALTLSAELAARLPHKVDASMLLASFSAASNKAGKRRFSDLTARQQGWVLSVIRDVMLGAAEWVNADNPDEPADIRKVR